MRLTGRVETLKETYGFIRGEDGEAYFVIPSLMLNPVEWEGLDVDRRVEFAPSIGPRGPRAAEVTTVPSTVTVDQ